MLKKSLVIILLFYFFITNNYAQETWYYHIQMKNAPTLQHWKHSFDRSAEELSGIINFEYSSINLKDFMSSKLEAGLYSYHIIGENKRAVKTFYFKVIDSKKYLISYVQEPISGNDIGGFIFQTFCKTYPVKIKVQDNLAQNTVVEGLYEFDFFYSKDYLLGKNSSQNKITVAYIYEEGGEVGFQEMEVTDGIYYRSALDRYGKISLTKSMKFPPLTEEFSIYYYYGFSKSIPSYLQGYTISEFENLKLRRTIPITIIITHKKHFYRPLLIQTYVPFFKNTLELNNIVNILALEKNFKLEKGSVFKGTAKKELKLVRLGAKVTLQIQTLDNKPISRPHQGAGKIEIVKENGNRLVYGGRSNFRPSRSPFVIQEMAIGKYIFVYKPFYSNKYIIQRREVQIKKDQTIIFKPYKRIPYFLYEIQRSVYNPLLRQFSSRELRYHIRSLTNLHQFFSLLEQKKATKSVYRNFVNSLIEVYERNRKRIWNAIPADHPQYINFHFDLAEIYWRQSAYYRPLRNLQKSLAMIAGEEIKLEDFCKKWYFTPKGPRSVKKVARDFLRKKPGLLKKVRHKWTRYRIMYCIGIILTDYYRNIYKDVSQKATESLCASLVTLSQCFKMKKERSRALGEEHPGLDYNVANMIAKILELTAKRSKSANSWTLEQKKYIGKCFYESETKHLIYSALAYLEALGEEFERPNRWSLQIIPENLKKDIVKNCRPQRRQELEQLVNEILRRWRKK